MANIKTIESVADHRIRPTDYQKSVNRKSQAAIKFTQKERI
jgi:hypothetical protein